MAVRLQIRRGNATEWTSANPILMAGELGVELDTMKWKIGNGTTPWTTLQYVTQGIQGLTGKNIEYAWNGTQLGVRQEGQVPYQYVDLKGKDIEFNWSGTQLGVRQQGQTEYQYTETRGKNIEYIWDGTNLGVKTEGELVYQYTDLRGKNLEYQWSGTNLGVRTEGETVYNYTDLKGDNIQYVWDGTQLGIKTEGEIEYNYVDLRGRNIEFAWNGTQLGVKTEGSPSFQYTDLRGDNIQYVWNGTQLGVKTEGEAEYSYVDLKGEKGDKGTIWRGEYNPADTYQKDDIVHYSGTAYISLSESTGINPTNVTYWDIFAKKGADGNGVGDMLRSVYDTLGREIDVFQYIDDGNGMSIEFIDELLTEPLPRDADTLGGYHANDFLKTSDISGLQTDVSTLQTNYNTLSQSVDAKAPSETPIVSVTGNKSLLLSDKTTIQKCSSASAITITIPTNASVPFPIGTEIVLVRYGVGTVTVAGSGGVVINSSDSLKSINKQYEAITLKKFATDEWLLIGALS